MKIFIITLERFSNGHYFIVPLEHNNSLTEVDEEVNNLYLVMLNYLYASLDLHGDEEFYEVFSRNVRLKGLSLHFY